MLNTKFSIPPPQHTLVWCAHSSSIPYVSMHGGPEKLCKHPSPSCSPLGHPHPDLQALPRFLPSWKCSCNYRAVPLPPLHLPEGQTPRGWGLWDSSRKKPQPALQRPGYPGFPLKHQPSTCKGRGCKCSLSGRVWQPSEVKVALLPNLNSTVVLELLKLADISLFQGKKNFFPFPKSWWCQPHFSHMPHTHREALPLKLLHCEEKGCARFTANAWEVWDFRSTHRNNRKPHLWLQFLPIIFTRYFYYICLYATNKVILYQTSHGHSWFFHIMTFDQVSGKKVFYSYFSLTGLSSSSSVYLKLRTFISDSKLPTLSLQTY